MPKNWLYNCISDAFFNPQSGLCKGKSRCFLPAAWEFLPPWQLCLVFRPVSGWHHFGQHAITHPCRSGRPSGTEAAAAAAPAAAAELFRRRHLVNYTLKKNQETSHRRCCSCRARSVATALRNNERGWNVTNQTPTCCVGSGQISMFTDRFSRFYSSA